MDYELSAYFADGDGLDFLYVYFALDGLSEGGLTRVLEVIEAVVSDEDIPLLLLLVVVELENQAAQKDSLCISQEIPPVFSYLTMLLSCPQFNRSNLPTYIDINTVKYPL